MSPTALKPDSPALYRFWAYLLERFPPVVYSILVALFYGSAVLVSAALVGEEAHFTWQAPVVILLVFFHLRVFDEHKDAKEDQEAHPDRLLSRGIIRLGFLKKAAVVAILAEAGLAFSLSPRAGIAWFGCFFFSVLMATEFGVGKWLNQHMMAYAFSHNPITPLLGVFAWATTGLAFAPLFGWYLGSVAAGALAFELGRKMRLPDEEQPGVSTYSACLGRRKSGEWLSLGALVCVGCAVPIVDLLDQRELVAYALLLPAGLWVLACGIRPVKAKTVEGSASLLLLISFIAFGVVAW
jgi:4-hydroxybenzoate polyprenyltransferase